jgi:cytochrome oxidase Cu insertion factor (SCO1/SenC/PrrC family)
MAAGDAPAREEVEYDRMSFQLAGGDSIVGQRRGELDWLIGPLPELLKAWKRFAVFSALQSGKANAHSADVRLFDAAGIWVSTLHAGVDLTPTNLAHDIRVALADRR